jgi:hypothetical protein
MKRPGAFAYARSLALVLSVPLVFVAAGIAGCAPGSAAPAPYSASSGNATGATSGTGAGTTGQAGTGTSSDAGPGPVASATPQGVGIFSASSTCSAGPSVGPSPLRRISRVEYNDMVRDLLGDNTLPASDFVSESPLGQGVNFYTNTYTTVQSTLVPQQYLEAAETLAATAVGSANTLQNLVGCSGAQQNDACAQSFIDSFANRAFRGQYDSTESQALFQIYSTTKAAFDFATGIQAVITAVLTSPRFLFVLEFGQPGSAGAPVLLTPNELATRLSLFLWRSIPDTTLLNDAASGMLATPAGIASEVTRMIQNPNAEAALDDFASQWMQLENTPSVTKDTQFGNWNAQLASDLQQETLQTFYHEVAIENSNSGATLTELLTSNESYINTNLATFYGVSGGDATWNTKTNVNPSGVNIRAGILTQGAVMATQAHTSLPSPVLRGKLVREQVMCDAIPDPPAAINGVPIPPPPASVPAGQTTNGEYAEHMNNAACSGCHTYMDPIGFTFANFDATGAYQATDINGMTDAGAGPPIDAGGSIVAYGNGELASATVNGPVDLATQLAAASQVQECYTLQQFRYALGRLESTADACSLQQAFQAFSAQGAFNLQQVLIAIAQSDSFRYRNAEIAGSTCQ